MNLSEHFALAEFTASDTAARRGIDNSVPPELMDEARRTCEMLERIRAHLGGVPILLTSGYRCPALNTAIGSSGGSDHLKAAAADIKAPAFGTAFEVASSLAPAVDELGIGQLIHEFGSWVHVSTRRPSREVNRIITISNRGTEAGIRKVFG